MNRSALMIFVTVLSVIASVLIVVAKKIPPAELHLLFTQGVVPATFMKGGAHAARKAGAAGGQRAVAPETALPVERTDEELNKLLTELPILQEIPWRPAEIASMFANRTARPCRMLPPESAIETVIPPNAELDGKLISQRVTAFTVGLEMDRKARASLPSVSKTTIENYLNQNQLAIQPDICRNRQGQFLFTGAVHAALFAKNMPSVAGYPEPMIEDAVRSFRVLGVLPPRPAADGTPGLPRTLVMAFTYIRDKHLSTSLTQSSQAEYELIFLHLLPQPASSLIPSITVFTTTEGCTVFQELNLADQMIGRSDPAVMASIRFDKFEFLGLYPADPVVTGLSNKVRGSISMEDLQTRLHARTDETAAALETVLDEFHHNPTLTQMTETWMIETR